MRTVEGAYTFRLHPSGTVVLQSSTYHVQFRFSLCVKLVILRLVTHAVCFEPRPTCRAVTPRDGPRRDVHASGS
jgi:hypothetical protein